jgi:glycosyltransferase involved in cell wall biosynthesis
VTPPSPLRLLHYLDNARLDAGGVCRAVLDLCAQLASRGHAVTLVTQVDQDVPPDWKEGRPGGPRALHLPHPNRARAAALVAGQDAVHLHGMWTVTNLPFARAALRLGVPYVFSPHGMLDDWAMSQKRLKKRLYLALAGRRLLERAAFVHCAAAGELDQARTWFPRGRGRAVPLILDLSPFRDLPGPEPARARFPMLNTGRPVLLFLSRLHPVKRVEVLLRAAAALRDAGQETTVLIAGPGDRAYADRLAALARELRLDDRVAFLGPVYGPEKTSLYQAADVLVFPSGHENFGFVSFEALAAGTPVVTTRDVLTWPELEQSGGAVITDGSVQGVAAGVDALLKDPARARAMGRAAREWVLHRFEPGSIVGEYEAMYRRAAPL